MIHDWEYWQNVAKERGIHAVDINIFVTENEFCPTCKGKFGEFPEGESAVPHFLGMCVSGKGQSSGGEHQP